MSAAPEMSMDGGQEWSSWRSANAANSGGLCIKRYDRMGWAGEWYRPGTKCGCIFIVKKGAGIAVRGRPELCFYF